jgi:hypothetical protein
LPEAEIRSKPPSRRERIKDRNSCQKQVASGAIETQLESNPHDDCPWKRVDIINGITNKMENFKKRAVSYAEGEAPKSAEAILHVTSRKINTELCEFPSVFVCNCLPLFGNNLHKNFTMRPQ